METNKTNKQMAAPPATTNTLATTSKDGNKASSAFSRNPYINFLDNFRKKNLGLPATETIRRGAAEWKRLSPEIKTQYIEAAFYVPKRLKQYQLLDAAEASEEAMRESCMRRPKRKKTRSSSRRGCGRRSKSRKSRIAKNPGCRRKTKPSRIC